MENHFELEIMCFGKSIGVTIQRLSQELPLIYAVWPNDDFLKKSFDNEFVLFTRSLKGYETKSNTLWQKVHYSKGVKSFNLEFENAVWEVLERIENLNIQ